MSRPSHPNAPLAQPASVDASPLTVWLTGASGFIGSALAPRLRDDPSIRLLAPSRAELDLTNHDTVAAFVAAERPDVVVHLAARTAGSAAMRREPTRFLMANLDAAAPLLRAVEAGVVPRVIVAGSAGEYPRLAAMGEEPRALSPADVWRGPPAAGGYGLARRTISQLLLDASQAAGTEAAVLVLPTVYGPGDGATKTGGVNTQQLRALPAFVLRMLAALTEGSSEVKHFGSGFEQRDFLHVDDAVAAFVAAVRAPIAGRRLHVTSGVAVRMAEVAQLAAQATGYEGQHIWLHRADGQRDSADRVWLGAAGLDALGFTPQRSLAPSLPAVVADLKARMAR